jgi:hypothetical protein
MRTLPLLLLLCGCTTVSADVQNGTVTVYTFLTSRQDVVVESLPDGTSRWVAKQSDANSSLADALLNISKVAAKGAGVP